MICYGNLLDLIFDDYNIFNIQIKLLYFILDPYLSLFPNFQNTDGSQACVISRTTQTLWCYACILTSCLPAPINHQSVSYILKTQLRKEHTNILQKNVFSLPSTAEYVVGKLILQVLGDVIINIKGFRERCFRLQGALSLGCPSFIIRSVFMEQAGKLNIAAQWAQSHCRKNKTIACCCW